MTLNIAGVPHLIPVLHSTLPSAHSQHSAPPAEQHKFTIEEVSFWYGAKQALFDITLSVPERSVAAFIGPSGCGKSTLLRLLNRMNDLIEGTRLTGRVLLDGQDVYASRIDAVGPAPAGGDGVPEVEPVPQVDLREHRLRPTGCRGAGPAAARSPRRAVPEAGGALERGEGPARGKSPWSCPAGSSSGCASPVPWRPTRKCC